MRVTNPAAANSPTIVEAVKRALVESGFERDADMAARYMLACCTDPHLGLWIMFNRGAPCCVLACSLPNNPLAQNPEVFVNANWGPAEANAIAVREAVAFAKAAGYNKLVTWNRTGRPDAVFARKYRQLGPCRTLGTMCEFTEAAG